MYLHKKKQSSKRTIVKVNYPWKFEKKKKKNQQTKNEIPTSTDPTTIIRQSRQLNFSSHFSKGYTNQAY